MASPVAYRKLIGRLTLDALEAPRAYRRKAIAVAALGHVYVFGLFLACGALAVGGYLLLEGFSAFLMIAAGCVLTALAGLALWTELPAPAGHVVQGDEAPKLWELLHKLSRKLHAPVIDEIVIDEQFGVRIEHFPRLLFVGPARHVLVLGLPWLQALSPKQAAAGIAHEYARLCHRRGGLDAWFSRTREFWPRYVDALPEDAGMVADLLRRLLARYADFMSAYTLPFACDLFIKADAIAAACVGPERTAQCIVRGEVLARWIDNYFWHDFMRGADNLPEPERLPYQSMPLAFRAADRSASLRRCYQDELRRRRTPDEVRPVIADRLRVLKQHPELTGTPERSAAEHLLGAQLASIVQAFDADWLQRERGFWRQRHEAVQAARMWLGSFGEPDVDQLSIETLTQYAQSLLTIGDRGKALPLLRRAAEHPQGTAETAWSVAEIMLEHDEVDALPYLDLVIDRDALRAREAAGLALQIAERHGRRDRIGHYRRCVEQLSD